LTAVFAVPVTVARNWSVSESPTEAESGATLTRMPESSDTVAVALFVVSAVLVALTVTVVPLAVPPPLVAFVPDWE
jgi:hypothetical protein